MKKSSQIALMATLMSGIAIPTQAQMSDRAAIEHELAVTAYNYAVGCELQDNYEEALVGLSHIPAGQLTAQQQAWADTLRMKCEAITGHPMAADEIALSQSEQLSVDDQSESFITAIRYYQTGSYAAARDLFSTVIEMGEGPRPQVAIEAIFWRGQCQYQLGDWEGCCRDLILFNDTKNADTDAYCDAKAYYTMGYARMQARKWHQARLNFERYLDHETDRACASYADGEGRLRECRALEAKTSTTYRQPLAPQQPQPTSGQTVEIENLLMVQDTQMLRERQANTRIMQSLRTWHAPYITEE